MTMLTHRARPVRSGLPMPRQGETRHRQAVRRAHLAMIKRILVGVVTMLTAGAAVAAIMALKIAIYLPRFIHH